MVVVALAACGGADDTATTAPTAPTTAPVATTRAPATTTAVPEPPAPRPPDPLEELLDERGALTLDTALAVFAATFRELPDVDPAPTALHGHDTAVLATLAAHWYELSDAQRAAIEPVLYPRAATPRGLRTPRSPGAAAARTIADEASAYFASRLGLDLGVLVTIVEQPEVDPGTGVRYFTPDTGAAAGPRYSMGDDGPVYDECVIRINTDAAGTSVRRRGEVAHEVFHCFQYHWAGYLAPYTPWVHEGTAAWAGFDFAGPAEPYESNWWGAWVTRPERDLYTRSYDAIGLFALADAHGGSPYAMVANLFSAPDLSQVLARTGPALLDRWGTHLAGEPGWGADYALHGPGAPSTGAARHPLTVPVDGGIATFPSPPHVPARGAQVYEFDAPGDVVRVVGPGAGRLRSGDGVELALSAGGDMCVRPGGCECPAGQPTPPHVTATDRALFVGLGPSDALPLLSAMTLETWCGPPPTTPPTAPPTTAALAPEACVVGAWVMPGDQVAAYYAVVNAESPTVDLAATGAIGMTFGADGTFTYTPDVVLTLTSVGLAGTGHISGTVQGSYTAGGGVITATTTGSTVGATVNVNGMALDATEIFDAVLLAAPVNGAPYTCGEQLTIEFATPSGRTPVRLTRAG